MLFLHSDFAILTRVLYWRTPSKILNHCGNINVATCDPTEVHKTTHFIKVLTLLLWLIVQLWHIDFATILRYPQITFITLHYSRVLIRKHLISFQSYECFTNCQQMIKKYVYKLSEVNPLTKAIHILFTLLMFP